MSRFTRRIPITPQPFRLWLTAKLSDTVVGHTCSARFCVLATYLKERTLNNPVISMEVYRPDEFGPFLDLPEWAKEFVHRLDDELAGRAEAVAVTAGQALEILTGVPA